MTSKGFVAHDNLMPAQRNNRNFRLMEVSGTNIPKTMHNVPILGRLCSLKHLIPLSGLLKRTLLALLAMQAALLSGCASCPPYTQIDIPPRPTLIPVSAELWRQVPLEAQDIFTHNDLELKRYVKQLEARIQAVSDN